MKKIFYKYAALMDGEVRYSMLAYKLSNKTDLLFLGEIAVDVGSNLNNHAELLKIKHDAEWVELGQ